MSCRPIFAPRHASFLLSDEDMPPALRRSFVLSGYRAKPFECTWGDVLGSLAYVHNETGNIYTHLVAAAIVTAVAVFDKDATASFSRTAYVVAVMVMALFSAGYHLFRHHSRNAFEIMYPCDLCGIVVLIFFSFAWAISLGFRCSPGAKPESTTG